MTKSKSLYEYDIGDIVKVKHIQGDVYGVIIGHNYDYYKVFWFDEDTQKENHNNSYPPYFMIKVS